MKAFLTTLTIGLLVSACVKTDRTSITPEDPNWIRLEAPTGGEAMDVAGNIDSVLFVATVFDIYKTSDQGKSWERIRHESTGPQGLYLKQDTLWRLTNHTGTGSGDTAIRIVSGRFADYTVDGGKTWTKYANSVELQRQINRVTSPDGTTYTVKENSTPVSSGSTTAYVNPSGITKRTNITQQQLSIPFRSIVRSLLLDSKNRLYVAIAGTHLPETNRINCCSRDLPSVVYVSRQPLP